MKKWILILVGVVIGSSSLMTATAFAQASGHSGASGHPGAGRNSGGGFPGDGNSQAARENAGNQQTN